MKRIPVDVYALLAVTIGVLATHVPVVVNGMNFNDPTWYFHFGNRVNHGDVPYRDFVFQVGPLPIYIDALFQQVFGTVYVASLYAGLLAKILRVWAVWLVASRVTSYRAAALLAVFCAFDTAFGFVHNWSTPWADLLITISALCFLFAARATSEPRALRYLGLAGLTAALTITARQSTTAVIAAMLLGATVVLLARKDSLTPKRCVALWGGFAAGIALFFVVLVILGVAGPAIQQMFLDAPAKKAVHGIPAILDAVSGGGIVDWRYTYVTGFLYFIGLPVAISIAVIVAASRDRPISTATLVVLAAPTLLAIALLARDASLEATTDLPRTFLAILVMLAVLVPARARDWFGLEPLVALGLGGLFLASDWALEMSAPGRGWGDPTALAMGVVLVALASSRIPERLKLVFCTALAGTALVHVSVLLAAGSSPFQELRSTDGTLSENAIEPRLRGPGAAMVAGMEMTPWRARSIEWLSSVVEPGSTCFVYANMPSLYDLLDCTNPTLVDSTIADFPSAGDARRVAATLKANPPDFIIAHERMWMSPPISQEIASPKDIASWNPEVSYLLHRGLRDIIDRYESLGTVAEAIGPGFTRRSEKWWDAVESVRVYRRVR